MKDETLTENLMRAIVTHAGEDGLRKFVSRFGGMEVEISGLQTDNSPLASVLGFDVADRINDELLVYDADGKAIRSRCYIPSGRREASRAEIRGLLVEGLTSIEVARRVGLSVRTIIRHAKRIRAEGCNVPILPGPTPKPRQPRLVIGKLEVAIIRGQSAESIARTFKRPLEYVTERAALMTSRGVLAANPYGPTSESEGDAAAAAADARPALADRGGNSARSSGEARP